MMENNGERYHHGGKGNLMEWLFDTRHPADDIYGNSYHKAVSKYVYRRDYYVFAEKLVDVSDHPSGLGGGIIGISVIPNALT